ncbi:MAG: hypothetical protein N3E51_05060 [Candidatus Micrarchaeota archaeon]|nr:hypothetical protein [Candidatus Micrarchaeota archaeon]
MEWAKPVLKIAIKILFPAVAVEKAVSKALNWLDFFQHTFFATAISSADGKAKGEAERLYREFCKESLRKLGINTALCWIPLPFANTLRGSSQSAPRRGSLS